MPMLAIYQHLRAAYGFLLRVPLIGGAAGQALSGRALSAQALWACIPIGLLIGALTAFVAAILQFAGLPDRLIAWALIGFMALITGALHEDGLADVLDGFFGGSDAAARLKIMKAPDIGVFAVLGLLVLKSIEAELLIAVLRSDGGLFFIAALAGISRGFWGVALQLAEALPTTKASLAHKLGAVKMPTLIVSLLLAAGLAWASAPFLVAVILWGGLLLLCFAWVSLCRYKIGGITGDCLGAQQQLSFLLGLIIYVTIMVL